MDADVLLKAAKPNTDEQIALAEVIALRTILLNAFYKQAQGETLTADEMQRLIERGPIRTNSVRHRNASRWPQKGVLNEPGMGSTSVRR